VIETRTPESPSKRKVAKEKAEAARATEADASDGESHIIENESLVVLPMAKFKDF
jgi:hypothetical protein